MFLGRNLATALAPVLAAYVEARPSAGAMVLLVPQGGRELEKEDYVDETDEDENGHALIFGAQALTAR